MCVANLLTQKSEWSASINRRDRLFGRELKNEGKGGTLKQNGELNFNDTSWVSKKQLANGYSA